LSTCAFWIIAGSGAYGASVGLWRAPLQGLYVGLKLPLLIGLTTLGNCLINGMLAQILGARLSFRQSALAVIMSFALLSIILGSLTPVCLFLLWNLPGPSAAAADYAHNILILVNVLFIAFAGIVANHRLSALLRHLTDAVRARRILFAWLGSGLFLGAQLTWNLRPFIGIQSEPVQFVRPNPFDGTFYEAVAIMIKALVQ